MSRKSVLIIDNNTEQRNSLKLLIWKLGCIVHESDNGYKAEAIIRDNRPELVLLSIDCDKVFNGLLQRIKNVYEGKVIVYSDRITRNDIIRYSAADEILLNPGSQIERLILYLYKSDGEMRKCFARPEIPCGQQN